MVKIVLSTLTGILILFPFIVTILFLFLMRRRGRAPVAVIGRAADLTTPVLFVSIYITSMVVIGRGVGFYIAGIAILIAIGVAVLERIRNKEFQIVRFLQKIWRLYFILLSLSYIILMVIGVLLKISEYVK